MRLATEEINKSVKTLFIFRKKIPLIQLLKNKLTDYQYEIFSSPIIPKRPDQFKYVFIFDNKALVEKFIEKKDQPQTMVILINQKKELERLSRFISTRKITNLKIINIDETLLENESLVEKIIWFMISKSKERVLNLESLIKRQTQEEKKKPLLIYRRITKKNLLLFLFLVFFLIEIFFIFPLLGAGLFLYKSMRAFEKGELKQSKNYLYYSWPFISLTKKTYSLSRPILSFFYLALFPDNIIYLEENSYIFLQTAIEMIENGKKIIPLVLKIDKEDQQKKELLIRLDKFKLQVKQLSKRIPLLSTKINYQIKQAQQLKQKLIEVEETTSQLSKFFDYTDELLGKNEEKNYLILFQNNMELRPGGGFIGSFGIITMADYTLKKLTIEDVYNADGQLKAHIEPPPFVRKYLGPHGYLRDSNTSPDFLENVKKAEFFLEKELGLKNFDGAIGITTTAIKYLLEGFGDIYLPDYQEVINKDNFYIKTQTYVEKNFFPGSIQKKTFLSSLVKILLLKLEDASFKDIAFSLKRSFAEKQIVLYFKNEVLQKYVDLFFWNGRLIIPKCANQANNCLVDNLFPIDANVGVNKANFFISRIINFKVKIKESGEIENFLSLTFKNDSPTEIFPGGTYKNYFQIYLPKNSIIKQATKDGILVDYYEEKGEDQFKIVAFYFEVPPKKLTEIKINYLLKEKFTKGKNLYQLIVQKQIGSANNDLILEFYFPNNIYVINQNFSTLAKENSLIYNTSLSTDKIFFIELTKE